MKKFKLRFHLASGKHFMQWQIRNPDGTVEYHDPETTTIHLTGVRFYNRRVTAEKIYNGSKKEVVAWVEAESVTTENAGVKTTGVTPISYNPRVAPHWIHEGQNADDKLADYAITQGRQVYIP